MADAMSLDRDYQEQEVTKVDLRESVHWMIDLADGSSFWVPADSPVEPKVGSKVRFYGRLSGGVVRGMVIDGVTVFYHTEAEMTEKLRRMFMESQGLSGPAPMPADESKPCYVQWPKETE